MKTKKFITSLSVMGLCIFLSFTVAKAQTDLNRDLIIAAGNGETNAVQTLLNKGADVNAQDEFGLTVLMFAAKSGNTTIVKLLLAKGASVNTKSKLLGYTALMNAAGFGNVEMVQALLDKGAEVNMRNNDGTTALTFANESKKSEIVKLLKKNGATK